MKKIIPSLFSLLLIISTLSLSSCGNKKPVSSSSKSGSSNSASVQSNDSNSESENPTADASNLTSLQSGAKTSSVSSKTKTTSSVTQNVIKDPLNVNLKGAKITIYSSPESESFKPKSGSSQTNTAKAKRLKTLETKLNCKIEVKTGTADSIQQQAFTSISSGKAFAHIVETNIHTAIAYINSQLIVDLQKVPSMDLTQAYMNPNNVLTSSLIGKGKWFTGSADMYSGTTYCYFFNKRILSEIGYKDSDLYSLVNSNNWTVAKLVEIAKKAVKDLDGKIGMTKADRFGIIQIDTGTVAPLNLMTANGAQMLKADGKGGFTYNMEDKSVIDSINQAYDMFIKDGYTYSTGSDDELKNLFMTGHSLFLGGFIGSSSSLANMDDDFGLVPFPRGKASNISTAVNWNCPVLMIPENLSSSELSNAGSFIQAFNYLSSDLIKTESKEYNDRYFRDDDSSKMFEKASSTQTVVASSILGSPKEWSIAEGTYRALYNVMSKLSTAEATVQQNKNVAISALKELLDSLK